MPTSLQHCTAPLLIASTLLLSACSGEPSKSDVRKLVELEVKPALEAQMATINNFAGLLGKGAMQPTRFELKDVNKIGCEQVGDSAYRCDVELVIQAGNDSKSQVMNLKFVKGSDGWILMK